MSNAIRYDAPLVRYLALELNQRLAGARLHALRLDGARRRAVLELATRTSAATGADEPATSSAGTGADHALVWELHPMCGWVWLRGRAPTAGMQGSEEARPTATGAPETEAAATGIPGRGSPATGAPATEASGARSAARGPARTEPAGASGVSQTTAAVQRRIALTRQTRIAAVRAPVDERWMVFELAARRRSPGQVLRLVVELMGNQWNLLALDGEDRIVAALWRRHAGQRVLRPGAHYQPPTPGGRLGVEQPLSREGWRALLESVPPAERRRRLIARVAYTSPLNADALLGAATESDEPAALDAAYDRYFGFASLPPVRPDVLELDGREQPYPLPLPGIRGRPAATLLGAMAAVAGKMEPAADAAATGGSGEGVPGSAEAGPAPPAPAPPRVAPELIERLRARLYRSVGRIDGLRRELEGARPEAAALRRKADLLLSQLGRVRKGMTRVELADFAGGVVEAALDPALEPAENATRLYNAARKRERAAERLPALIRRAEDERARIASLLERAEAGAADPSQVEAEIGAAVLGVPKGREGHRLAPYRRYRTSGGLEVRVGRNRRANDALTFHHSAANDVWLHARAVAGSHVILRWDDADANPPARDLYEAAVLAALHSRARTSGVVAVDWTRRKYVRKPRKSPPGLVVPERVKTLFVEPDTAVERRLRVEA